MMTDRVIEQRTGTFLRSLYGNYRQFKKQYLAPEGVTVPAACDECVRLWLHSDTHTVTQTHLQACLESIEHEVLKDMQTIPWPENGIPDQPAWEAMVEEHEQLVRQFTSVLQDWTGVVSPPSSDETRTGNPWTRMREVMEAQANHWQASAVAQCQEWVNDPQVCSDAWIKGVNMAMEWIHKHEGSAGEDHSAISASTTPASTGIEESFVQDS